MTQKTSLRKRYSASTMNEPEVTFSSPETSNKVPKVATSSTETNVSNNSSTISSSQDEICSQSSYHRTRQRRFWMTQSEVQKRWNHLANDFIHTGYRGDNRMRSVCRSIFQIHNETVNIWSHLLGAVLFAMFALQAVFVRDILQTSDQIARSHSTDYMKYNSFPRKENAASWQGYLQLPKDVIWPRGHSHSCAPPPIWASLPSYEITNSSISNPSVQSIRSNVVLLQDGKHTREFTLWEIMAPHSLAEWRWSQMASDLACEVRSRLYTAQQALSSGFRESIVQIATATEDIEQLLESFISSPRETSAEAWRYARNSFVNKDRITQLILTGLNRVRSAASESAASSITYLHNLEALLWRVARCVSTYSTPALTELNSSLQNGFGGSYNTDTWPMLVFLCSAMFCLGCSVMFHWWGIVSRQWYDTLARLDYTGISVLIAGSGVPIMFYGFYCEGTWLHIHMGLYVSVCALSVLCNLLPYFSQPKLAWLRACVFVATGCFGVIPALHLLYLNWWRGLDALLEAIYFFLGMGGFYLVGAVLYACRIPERFKPGSFDLLFASHQIFHILVVVAALLHYFGLKRLMFWHEAVRANGVCNMN